MVFFLLVIEGHDLTIVLSLYHRIRPSQIELEVWKGKFLWDQSCLDRLRDGRSVHMLDGLSNSVKLGSTCSRTRWA